MSHLTKDKEVHDNKAIVDYIFFYFNELDKELDFGDLEGWCRGMGYLQVFRKYCVAYHYLINSFKCKRCMEGKEVSRV